MMSTTAQFLLNYIYRNNNLPKMVAAHILEPLIAGGNIALPLVSFNALRNVLDGESPVGSLALSAGILVSNMILPKLHAYLIDSVRNTVQRDITVDMVKKVYDRELNTVLGSPTGACAVMTSKNYGTVGEVMPTSYGLVIDVLEVIGISCILTQWYGSPGIIPLIGLGSYLACSRYLEDKTEALKHQNSMLRIHGFTSLLGAINNYIPAHQFGKVKYELERLNNRLTEVESSYTGLDRAKYIHSVILSFVKQAPLLLLLISIASEHINTSNILLTKEILLSLYFMMRFSSLMDPLPGKLNMLSTGLVDTKMLSDFINEKDEISDPNNPIDFKISNAPKISFQNVRFKYQGSESESLSDITFDVLPKQKVVIMGPTGCGKTTLLKLLQRFYNFDGKILINDVDITHLTKQNLRSRLAVVSQETGLMEGTLYDNIEYGNPSSDESRKENKVVFQAAKYAGLEFERMRFFAPVKQQGADFSGGERQRINIARFLARTKLNQSARIFLMDEPTSALDQKKTSEVIGILDQLSEFGTTIMITHDPALAANADQIIYLIEGKIIEQGTFEDLMKKQGYFYNQMLEQCKKLNVDIDSIRPDLSRSVKGESEFSKWKISDLECEPVEGSCSFR